MAEEYRQQQCKIIAECLREMLPIIFEGKARPDRLCDLETPLSRLEAVVADGGQGIEHHDYLKWLEHAPANLAELRRASLAGDADAAFAALRDAEHGVALLVQGCAGCSGW